MGHDDSPLLNALARQVRRLRKERGLSRDRLAEASGLSVRFLARVESGEGNISVLRLAALARALDIAPDRLLRTDPETGTVVALVGMRGAGKSTVGPLLAERLGMPFVEMDERIVEAGGLPLDQLFELHGERYYRRLERELLERLLSDGRPAVLAAGGGIVNEPVTWERLRRRATVVWLRARAEDHWDRVVAQGDRRPMGDNPAAMDELRAMLSAREPLYAQAALTVDTGNHSPDEIVATVVDRLDVWGQT